MAVIKRLFSAFGVLLVAYLLGAFIAVNFNIALWEPPLRIMTVIIGGVAAACTFRSVHILSEG